MPKLNLVGMIVLCLAVAAGAGMMALRAPAPHDHGPQVDHLMRQLGDTDPDLRRDAERELKQLGPKAEPALKAAVEGPDPELAARARAVLGIKPSNVASSNPDAVAKASDLEPGVRLTLQITLVPQRPEPLHYYLRLHNGTKRAISLARHLRDGRPEYSGFGAFECIDAEGRVVVLDDTSDVGFSTKAPTLEIVIVKPGESLDLAPGGGIFRIETPGTFRVRFAYVVKEGSKYREFIANGHHAISDLMGERFESNEVKVTVE